MPDTDPLVFNPLDPSFRIDPYPFYARLREQDPVHQTALGSWVISRYADCVALLKDPRVSSDLRNEELYRRAVEQGLIDPDQEVLQRTPPFLVRDPPDHTRLRGLVSKAFTPNVIEGLRPHVQELVDRLIDRAAAAGEMELIEEFAYPLPVTVICELLGVPPQDHETFKEWSRELSKGLDPGRYAQPDTVERRRRAGNAFAGYFGDLIAQRRKTPREDLLSALIAAEEQGDRLTPEELISTCIFLVSAGHETTVNLIGNGTLALLRHPDQLRRLRDDPSLTRSAVEELLRYDAPVHMAIRVAIADIEVGGRTIGRGQQIAILLGSANRDPAQFPEPDRLDIARRDNHHVAFGFGIHFCLGAPLARVEGEIAFAALVRRLQGIELCTQAPEYRENIVLRGPRALPVRFAGVLPA